MVMFMKEIGLKVRDKERELKNMLMVIFMKDIGLKERNMEREI